MNNYFIDQFIPEPVNEAVRQGLGEDAIDLEEIEKRIIEKIHALAEEPRPSGSEKFKSEEAFRIRQGDCRIVYLIDDEKKPFKFYVWVIVGRSTGNFFIRFS